MWELLSHYDQSYIADCVIDKRYNTGFRTNKKRKQKGKMKGLNKKIEVKNKEKIK